MQVTQGGDLIADGRIVAAPPKEAAQKVAENLEADAEDTEPKEDQVPADGEAPDKAAAPTQVRGCCMRLLAYCTTIKTMLMGSPLLPNSLQ